MACVLNISAQQTHELRLRDFLRTDTWSSCLEFMSFTSSSLPVCFPKHPCKQYNALLKISSITLETC